MFRSGTQIMGRRKRASLFEKKGASLSKMKRQFFSSRSFIPFYVPTLYGISCMSLPRIRILWTERLFSVFERPPPLAYWSPAFMWIMAGTAPNWTRNRVFTSLPSINRSEGKKKNQRKPCTRRIPEWDVILRDVAASNCEYRGRYCRREQLEEKNFRGSLRQLHSIDASRCDVGTGEWNMTCEN